MRNTSFLPASTIALVTLFFSASSFSDPVTDFSGHWKGAGMMTDSKGQKTPCSEIEIVIKQTPDSMQVDLYNAQCGILNSNWGPYLMGLKDSKVFEEEDLIGEIAGNIMKTLSASGGVQYAFNLRLNPNVEMAPSLDTYYGVRNLVGAIVIEGNLKPVP